MASDAEASTMIRRQFLRASALAPVVLAQPAHLFAAEYDLLIRGGRVLDPEQRLDRVADIAIRDGRISAIRPNIAPSAAKDVLDATGKLVMPGLIDIHTHLADKLLPPATCLADGVTTLLDAGSRAPDNAEDLLAIAKSAPNRVRILLNIGHLGVLPEGELLD